jgi:hypothetical protein
MCRFGVSVGGYGEEKMAKKGLSTSVKETLQKVATDRNADSSRLIYLRAENSEAIGAVQISISDALTRTPVSFLPFSLAQP